jgi:hypothetical protein
MSVQKVYAGQDALHTQYNSMVDFLQDDQYGHDHSGNHDGLDWGTPVDHVDLLNKGTHIHEELDTHLDSVEGGAHLLHGLAAGYRVLGNYGTVQRVALLNYTFTAEEGHTFDNDHGNSIATDGQWQHVFTLPFAVQGVIGQAIRPYNWQPHEGTLNVLQFKYTVGTWTFNGIHGCTWAQSLLATQLWVIFIGCEGYRGNSNTGGAGYQNDINERPGVCLQVWG